MDEATARGNIPGRNIDVFCVFPEAVEAVLRVGVVGRAIERGLVGLRTFNLRQYAPKGRIDDMPFGGGAGMVVRVDVVARALEEVYKVSARQVRKERRVLVTEPGGRRLNQEYVEELTEARSLTLLCGRYEGDGREGPDGACERRLFNRGLCSIRWGDSGGGAGGRRDPASRRDSRESGESGGRELL